MIQHRRKAALGVVVSVDPVVCDCGLLQVENPFTTHDARCVGGQVQRTPAGARVDGDQRMHGARQLVAFLRQQFALGVREVLHQRNV